MTQYALELVGRLKRETAKMNVDKAMEFATKDLISNYRRSLVAGGHVWTTNLYKRMYPKRLGRGVWTVVMPRYGLALDHMKPHYVALKRGRKIRRWYKEKVLGGMAPTKYPGKMWVEPKHFMDDGDERHPYNIAKYIEAEIWKAIKRAVGV